MTPATRIIAAARADWAPHIERTARRLAQVCAVVYCLGYATGALLHRTSDRLARLWVRLLVPSAPVRLADVTWPDIDFENMAFTVVPASWVVQPQAAAITPANVAPPRCRPADPMARAVHLVRIEGRSQRLAADLCGVSRSSLQRALKR